MPESPRLLIEHQKLQAARKSFKAIAKFNDKELKWDPIEFTKDTPSKSVETPGKINTKLDNSTSDGSSFIE